VISTVQKLLSDAGKGDTMKRINLEITIAADNHIPAFAAYVNYFGDTEEDVDAPKIVVNFNAMFGSMVENEDMDIKFSDFFAESVVHEMLHMVQDIFGKAFNEDQVEDAIMQCRKKEEPSHPHG
jgi:hypothetical protein